MKCYCYLLFAVGLLVGASLPARADGNTEYLVKAAFIYNFTKFVEWGGDKSIGTTQTITICMVGGNPFGSAESVFDKASNEKLTLKLVSKSPGGGLADCHIAFFANGSPSSAPSNVLTVGESDGFVDNGGMIGFKLVDNKVKLEVNRTAASAAGLRMNSQLLEVAVRVIK